MPESSPAAENLVSEILALIGRDDAESASAPRALFANASKKQLLDCAARLGMKGVSKLSREDLADRIEVAFAGLVGLPPARPSGHEVPEPSASSDDGHPVNGGGALPQKFALSQSPDIEPMPKDIPWGYGHDRVTAMPVDPLRLYV